MHLWFLCNLLSVKKRFITDSKLMELFMYQKIKVEASNSKYFPILMLPNVAFDAVERHFWYYTIGSKHQNGLKWKTDANQKIESVHETTHALWNSCNRFNSRFNRFNSRISKKEKHFSLKLGINAKYSNMNI